MTAGSAIIVVGLSIGTGLVAAVGSALPAADAVTAHRTARTLRSSNTLAALGIAASPSRLLTRERLAVSADRAGESLTDSSAASAHRTLLRLHALPAGSTAQTRLLAAHELEVLTHRAGWQLDAIALVTAGVARALPRRDTLVVAIAAHTCLCAAHRLAIQAGGAVDCSRADAAAALSGRTLVGRNAVAGFIAAQSCLKTAHQLAVLAGRAGESPFADAATTFAVRTLSGLNASAVVIAA